MPKIYSLQVFRALAALLVVFFHATTFVYERLEYTFLGNLFAFGYIGVDLFFVLSGFIIFYSYAHTITKQPGVWSYLYKRLSRVYPLYWLITTVKVALLFLAPGFAKANEQDLGLISRSYLLFPQQILPVIGVAWTLSYEILFYLLFALTFVFPARVSLSLAAGWLITIVAFWASAAFGQPISDHYLIRFLLNERNLEFLLGCLGAYLYLRQWAFGVKYSLLIWAIGCGLLSLAIFLLLVRNGVPLYFLFFGFPSLLVVLGSALFEQRRGNFWPSGLILLGDASYSIYLTHVLFMNVYLLIDKQLGIFTAVGVFLATTIMILFAVLGGLAIYFVLERPLLLRLQLRSIYQPAVFVGMERAPHTRS